MAAKPLHRLAFETELWGKGLICVAGVDEAGRGPLAGPVVAAAVILPQVWQDGSFGKPQPRHRKCETDGRRESC